MEFIKTSLESDKVLGDSKSLGLVCSGDISFVVIPNLSLPLLFGSGACDFLFCDFLSRESITGSSSFIFLICSSFS
uniref:Uncharacterized protein n=1 Tax=Lepeophtheirus salmonis TaxID=72036 RepID=A0A0K2VD50_LEPSM